MTSAARRTLPDVATARARLARDGCAVETAALAALVARWVDVWELRHGTATVDRAGRRNSGSVRRRDRHGHFARLAEPELSAVGELQRLCTEHGAALSAGAIARLLAVKKPYTELCVADALLVAIERPDALHGALHVVENPAAGRAARRACCGSSR